MIGKNIYLTNITQEDMPNIYKWFSDIDFLKYYDYVFPVPQTKEEVDKTFIEYGNYEKSKVFGVKMNCDDKIIGITGFDNIVSDNHVADLFIGIGERDSRGKGLGMEALELLIQYGFETRKFHRIQLNVLDFNKSAIKLYEKLGFIKEGVYREFVLRDNKRYDLLLYGLLKSEWENIK